MKDYIDIAKQYFKALEGLHLYPSLRTGWPLAWGVMFAIWLASIAWVAFGDHQPGNKPSFLAILIPEIIWFVITARIQTLKQQRSIEEVNRGFGTSFPSSEECRRHLLTVMLKRPPSSFLAVAQEIDDLMSIQKKFRKHSDQSWSELARYIYDRDSKARLLTLMIAALSMIVALTAKSDATLETLFDVYSDPGGQAFLAVIAVGAAVLFMLYMGLQIFFRTVMDGIASWSTKLFGTSQRWVLGYLVRDLTLHHCGVDPVPEAQDHATAASTAASLPPECHPSSANERQAPPGHSVTEVRNTQCWTSLPIKMKYDPSRYIGTWSLLPSAQGPAASAQGTTA